MGASVEKRITEEDLLLALQLLEQGASIAQIASEVFHCSIRTAYHICRENNLPLPGRQPSEMPKGAVSAYYAGASWREIWEQYGVSQTRFYYYLQRNGLDPRTKTPETIAAEEARTAHALEMYERGATLYEIQTETGLRPMKLYALLRERNIPTRRKRNKGLNQ